jgi:hypothetical protein
MSTKLRVEDLWPRLRSLAANRGPRYVAAPFVGQGSFSRLRLRQGDVLVTRCDIATVKCGLTDPREVVKYVKAGVEVHSAAALHAKVFVLGRTAIVGSSNVSAASENSWVEAGIETTNPQVVAQCKRFIEDLRGDVIGLADAKQLISSYRPPKGVGRIPKATLPRRRQDPGQSPIWVLGLEPCDYDIQDDQQIDESKASARKQMASPRSNELDDLRWDGHVPFKVRERVVMATSDSGSSTLVDAPARIVKIQRYHVGARPRAIVWVEKRRGVRRRQAKDLVKRVGPAAKVLVQAHGAKRLRSSALIYALGQIWPRAAFETTS